ncbi:hypothetical protein DYB26_014929, partial [Aphanomyces astaci]
TGDLHTISKPTALRIASTAWLTHMLPKNIVSGFETAGIFPVSLDNMMQRFKLFKGGGSPESYVHATWLVHQEAIRTEVLCLPGKGEKRVGRKTIDVGGRILTLSLLSEIDAAVEERKAATKRKLALQGKRATMRKKSQKGNTHRTSPIIEQRRGSDGTADLKTARAGIECTSRHMVEGEDEGEEREVFA